MRRILVVSLLTGNCIHFQDFTDIEEDRRSGIGAALAVRFQNLNQQAVDCAIKEEKEDDSGSDAGSTYTAGGGPKATARPGSPAHSALRGEGVMLQRPGSRSPSTSSRFAPQVVEAIGRPVTPPPVAKTVVLKAVRQGGGAAWFFAGDTESMVMVALCLGDACWDDASGDVAVRGLRDAMCIKYRQQLRQLAQVSTVPDWPAPLQGVPLMAAALGLRLLAPLLASVLEGLGAAGWHPAWAFTADAAAFMQSAAAAQAAADVTDHERPRPPPPRLPPPPPRRRKKKQSRMNTIMGCFGSASSAREDAAELEESIAEMAPPEPPVEVSAVAPPSLGPLQHLLHASNAPPLAGTAGAVKAPPRWTEAAVSAALELVQQVSLATVAIVTMERADDEGLPPCLDALDVQMVRRPASPTGAARLLAVRVGRAIVVVALASGGVKPGTSAAGMRAEVLQPLERLSEMFHFLVKVATTADLQGLTRNVQVL